MGQRPHGALKDAEAAEEDEERRRSLDLEQELSMSTKEKGAGHKVLAGWRTAVTRADAIDAQQAKHSRLGPSRSLGLASHVRRFNHQRVPAPEQ